MEIKEKLQLIINYFREKKYEYFKILDISKISTICDYFLIISFNNIRSLEVVEDEFSDFCALKNIKIRQVEGLKTNWILIDIDDIIVHMFNEKDRQFYNLEKLWADADIMDI